MMENLRNREAHLQNTLVKKSLRLPLELVDFVEAQEGKDFTGKLCGLLVEMKKGESKRMQDMAYYDRYIDTQVKRLKEYYDLVDRTTKLAKLYEELLRLQQREIDALANNAGVSQ